jgi:hypothetical protein
MVKRLSASEETELLRQTIREAHEATQALWDAIRAANLLAPTLTADFEAHANAEIMDLANRLQADMNEQSRQLNIAVANAREEIITQLALARPMIDPDTGIVSLIWPPGKFDDQVPLPYPQNPPKVSKS